MLFILFFILLSGSVKAMDLSLSNNATDQLCILQEFAQQPTPVQSDSCINQSDKWFLKSNYKKRKLQEPHHKATTTKSGLLFTSLCVDQEQFILQQKIKEKMETGICPLCPFKYEDNYQKQKDHFSVEHSRYKNACILCLGCKSRGKLREHYKNLHENFYKFNYTKKCVMPSCEELFENLRGVTKHCNDKHKGKVYTDAWGVWKSVDE